MLTCIEMSLAWPRRVHLYIRTDAVGVSSVDQRRKSPVFASGTITCYTGNCWAQSLLIKVTPLCQLGTITYKPPSICLSYTPSHRPCKG